MLQLRNPHSVLAALEHRPRDVLEVRLPSGRASEAWEQVATLARGRGVAVRRESKPRAERRSKEKSERVGVAEATVREREGVSLEELFTDVTPDSRGLWIGLDCVQDPHNVGAIFRTAAFFAVRGMVLTRDRSAPLTATVYDVASGGLETVPFAQPGNLSHAIEVAKEAGVWVLGASEHAERDIRQIPRDRPWMLVLGNEEQGLRRLTLDKCDEIRGLRPRGAVTSLNVSVAAGILMAALQPEGT